MLGVVLEGVAAVVPVARVAVVADAADDGEIVLTCRVVVPDRGPGPAEIRRLIDKVPGNSILNCSIAGRAWAVFRQDNRAVNLRVGTTLAQAEEVRAVRVIVVIVEVQPDAAYTVVEVARYEAVGVVGAACYLNAAVDAVDGLGGVLNIAVKLQNSN